MIEPAQPISAARGVDLASASIPEVLTRLRVDRETGLSRAEVDRRLRQEGYNEVPEPQAHPFRRFLGKFWGLSAWTLELILLLSWVLQKYADLVIVSGLLLVNAIVSVVQEGRASRAVETLRARLRVTARAQRDGLWQAVPARELVPGDLVRLRAGDIVPADVRVMSGELTVDQSALTGESLDVGRDPGALVYSGSLVRRGEADGVIVLTGRRTYFGRTTELVAMARPKLHVEAVVATLVRWLFLIVGTLLAVASGVALWGGMPLLEILPLMLVLLMSAVPVALPVMFTVSMAVGAMELARRGVLDLTQYHVDWDGREIVVRCTTADPLSEGDEAYVSVEPRHCVLLEDQDTRGSGVHGVGPLVAERERDPAPLRVDPHDGVDDVGVEMRPALPDDHPHRFVMGNALLVDALAHQRVVDVDDGHQAAGDGNLLTLEPARIAGAVPPLVVGVDDVLGQAEEEVVADPRAPLRVRDDLLTEIGVTPHLVPFFVGQGAGLSQGEVAHADLADVVDRSQPGNKVDRVRGEEVAETRVAREVLAERLHVLLRAEQVRAGLGVARSGE